MISLVTENRHRRRANPLPVREINLRACVL